MAVAIGDIAVLSGTPLGDAGGGGDRSAVYSLAFVMAAADGNGDVMVCGMDGTQALVASSAIVGKLTPAAP